MCTVGSCIEPIFKIALELRSMVQDMHRADDRREYICCRIQCITDRLNQLKSFSQEETSSELQEVLYKTRDKLRSYTIACKEKKQEHEASQFVSAHSNLYSLERLEKELGDAVSDLDTAIICFIATQNKKIQDQNHEIKMKQDRAAIQLYSISDSTLKPAQVSKPEVNVEGDGIAISWEYPGSDRSSLSFYDVMYHDIIKQLPEPVAEKCIISDPSLRPGRVYSIKVRANINGGVPGEWSEPALADYKTGPPNKPGRPNVRVTTTTAKVSCPIPGPEQCNGAPVDKAILKYCKLKNRSQWKSHEKAVLESHHIREFKFSGLSEDTIYQFCIILANKYGQSQPSEMVQEKTRVPVPGVPTGGRPSSHFTHSTAKICWKPPRKYPKYVAKYIVWYKIKKNPNEQWETKEIPSTKLYFEAQNLKSYTTYVFYIIAVNSNDEDCGEHERVEAETRLHISFFIEPLRRICQI